MSICSFGVNSTCCKMPCLGGLDGWLYDLGLLLSLPRVSSPQYIGLLKLCYCFFTCASYPIVSIWFSLGGIVLRNLTGLKNCVLDHIDCEQQVLLNACALGGERSSLELDVQTKIRSRKAYGLGMVWEAGKWASGKIFVWSKICSLSSDKLVIRSLTASQLTMVPS